MPGRYVPPYAFAVDANGVPYSGGTLTFYTTGTSDLQNTYSDVGLTVPNTNPVVANSQGQWPNIFMIDDPAYKVVLADQYGNQIWTADPVVPNDGGGSGGDLQLSVPQDGQPIVYDAALGAATNQLTGETTKSAQTASDVDIDIAAPPGSIGNYDTNPGDVVLLFAQADAVENGLWQVPSSGTALVRPSTFATGKTYIAARTVAAIRYGDFAGEAYQLVSPQTVIVDTDATEWELFEGAVYPQFSNTFLRGPFVPGGAYVESWGWLFGLDLPQGANGDPNAANAGRPRSTLIDTLGAVSQYWLENTPFDDHEMIVQRAEFTNRIWLDKPEIYVGTSIPGSVLSNRVMVADAPGSGRPASIVMNADVNGFSLATVNNFRCYGNLHIRYLPGVASTSAAVNITGTCSDLYFQRLTLENCNNGVRIVGTVNNLLIDELVLINWVGLGIYVQGSGSGSSAATNIRVRKITWINTTPNSTSIVVSTYDYTGAPGVPGVIVDGGSGSGEGKTYLQNASTAANAPQNCSVHLQSAGPVSYGFQILYGLGRTQITPHIHNGGAVGVYVGTAFAAEIDIIDPDVNGCQLHGIQLLATGMTRCSIMRPRIKSNNQVSAGANSGIRVESGVNNWSIWGGESGDNGGSAIQKYGLDIQGSSTTFFYVVFLDVQGNATSAINNSASAGTNIIKYCPGFTTGTWS